MTQGNTRIWGVTGRGGGYLRFWGATDIVDPLVTTHPPVYKTSTFFITPTDAKEISNIITQFIKIHISRYSSVNKKKLLQI